MKPHTCDEFQSMVSQYTLRHKSILDILTKTQECGARMNRAVVKAVTNCGCVEIKAQKKEWPDEEISLNNLMSFLNSHLEGELCQDCRDVVIGEIGKLLFYITALCNTLDINLQEVLEKEQSKLLMLGKFNLT